MPENFDITMTATVRPDILQQTLHTFVAGLFKNTSNFRLIINIDPVGDNDYSPQDVLQVAQKYFQNVKYNIPDEPDFAKAFIWTWKQTTTRYVFHLEDDWALLRPVFWATLIRLMDHLADVAILRLPFTDAEEDRAKQWDKWYPWNGYFFECPLEIRGGLAYSGHPSIIRHTWLRQILPLLNDKGCPEKQIKHHNPLVNNILLRWRYGVFQRQGEKRAILDIGRKWRTDHGYAKDGAYGFKNWKKIEQTGKV
jgi:hypothetical protein